MVRGRKPKPVELRVLHGGAAERARAGVARPRRSLPRCPEHLEGEAAKTWKRLARELYDAGLLSNIDRDALAAYCVVHTRWQEAEKQVAKLGSVLKTAAGNLIQNPYLAVANRALEQMLKIEAEFGMTPSSRTRVRAEPPEREDGRAAVRPSVTPEAKDDPRRLLA